VSAIRSRVNAEILQALSNDRELFVLTEGRIYDTESVLLKDEDLPLVTMRYFQGSFPAVTHAVRRWPLQIQAYSSKGYEEAGEVHDRITEVLHRKRFKRDDGIMFVTRQLSDPAENYDEELGDFILSSLFRVDLIHSE